MQKYLDLIQYILNKGIKKPDRTGIGTISIFGYQMRFNLNNGFPLLTTKKCHFSSIVHELIWFLKGDTNIKYLKENKVSIWDEWADTQGNLGPIYGKQWRSWNTQTGQIDQIQQVIDILNTDPHSRRIIVSSWNVSDLKNMALPPCHILFQFYISNNKLSCHFYQRSCDVFLGLPFNLASYGLLVHIMAQQCNFNVGELIWSVGDAHLYQNHLEQAFLQLKRIPRILPNLIITRKPKTIFDYDFKDFAIKDYYPYPNIKAPIAI
ncbi:thymidylate synthase [Candidatus Pantoea edessiphila]|uniref:Thymidylate synthase n=1 Tax=Candidatus Pantoea edessiphila TaxID=2044610 RepID=A0A2P5SXK7_9GAMM|nr:thymidylate synthase [Candidatus Pantoea edessiphila]MBK4775692.1 thymidylate synthase [Pantoea sp. Edef]PPI87077.1 thymidylate synthase [Candidatus Pantoea edessiphila]